MKNYAAYRKHAYAHEAIGFLSQRSKCKFYHTALQTLNALCTHPETAAHVGLGRGAVVEEARKRMRAAYNYGDTNWLEAIDAGRLPVHVIGDVIYLFSNVCRDNLVLCDVAMV